MKVIKEGVKYVWSKKFSCTGKGTDSKGCGAVLLVSETDLYHLYHEHWDGDETYSVFTCPCCGVETCVTVPDSVKHLGKRPKRKGKKK